MEDSIPTPQGEFTSQQGEVLVSDRADIVKQLLDSSETLAYVKAFLLGTTHKKSEDTGEWVVGKADDKKRLVEDAGLDGILKCVTVYLSTQATLSNLTPDKVNRETIRFEHDLMERMICLWKIWFAKRFQEDPNQLDPIMKGIKRNLGSLVHFNLTRAIGGEVASSIAEMSRRIDTHQIIEREAPQRRGIFGKITAGRAERTKDFY